jgi:hypothetical protein
MKIYVFRLDFYLVVKLLLFIRADKCILFQLFKINWTNWISKHILIEKSNQNFCYKNSFDDNKADYNLSLYVRVIWKQFLLWWLQFICSSFCFLIIRERNTFSTIQLKILNWYQILNITIFVIFVIDEKVVSFAFCAITTRIASW